MLDWSRIDPAWLVAVGALLLACGSLWLAGRALLRVRALANQLRESRGEYQRLNTSVLALHGAMKVIAEDVIDHGQHQSAVRRALERLVEQQSELRLRDVDEGLYGQAIELIRHGRGREEVRKLCALTASEVDLLFSLHGARVAREARSASKVSAGASGQH